MFTDMYAYTYCFAKIRSLGPSVCSHETWDDFPEWFGDIMRENDQPNENGYKALGLTGQAHVDCLSD